MPGATAEEERHLAILSRIPFSQIRIHHDLSFTYFDGVESPSRGMLEAEFVVNGIRWNLFNLHLKSKWTERKDDPNANPRCEKEARTIRDYLRKRFLPGEGHPYLLAGDFNDHKNSAPCAVSCKSMTSLLRKWFLASIPTDIFGPITMPSKIAIPVWIIFWPHPAFSRDWCRKALQSPTDIFPFGHPITG